MTKIQKANNRPNFPQIESQVSEIWKKNGIFEKSIHYRDSAPKYSFVDGPPFVSGTPHYGTLLPSIAKDVIPRYWTMKGFQVRRVFGWDCHGLPIEEKVSKKLNLKTHAQIEEYGVDNYIQECRNWVKSCTNDWNWYIEKIGRWVDMDNAYYTMNPEFNESVLWFFKQTWEKGLIYKGKRVSLFSTDNSTPVSEFEVNMDQDNYKEVEDTSIYVKFELNQVFKGHDKVNILAWTTTPWTIPAHAAIALSSKINYSLVEFEEQKYLVATDLISKVFQVQEDQIGEEPDRLVRILGNYPGKELVGLSYQPPYNLFDDVITEKHFKTYEANFVTSEDGTGFVHLATYGKEDFELFKEQGITPLESIDEQGIIQVGDFKGMYLRDAMEPITEDLHNKSKLFRSELHKHRLPHYRGKNPLIYYAQDSYFIDIQKIKPRMLELNNQINWYPGHLQQGRFRDVIENAPDWCISRNRFWATIMPLWRTRDGSQEIIIGSIEELAKYNDQIKLVEVPNKLGDSRREWYFGDKKLYLHRDICDKIVLTKDGVEYFRVPEVLDVWMDSGSVPFAEHHYPFENNIGFENSYPADYIIEYVGQIRAWFNIILRVAVIAFDSKPFKNAVVTGNIAGNDGRKMSKSFGNFSDPKEVLENIGGEALRLYLMGSGVMNGEDMNWSDNTLNDQVKNILIPFWNTYSYLTIYIDLNDWTPKNDNFDSNIILDKWLESIVNKAINNYSEALEKYDLPASVKLIQPLIDDVSTWWIRRSRDRFAQGDTQAIATLYSAITRIIKTFAPQMPFITEEIYQNLVVGVLPNAKESIHLENYPTAGEVDQVLLDQMQLIRQICSIGLKCRAQSGTKLRQPLQSALVKSDINWNLSPELVDIIKQELNVKEVILTDSIVENPELVICEENGIIVALDTTINEELRMEGLYREIVRQLQSARKNNNLRMGQTVGLELAFENEESLVSKELKEFIELKQSQLRQDLYLSKIEFKDSIDNGVEIKIEGEKARIKFD